MTTASEFDPTSAKPDTFDPASATPVVEQKPSELKRIGSDLLVSGKRGLVGVPEALVGLADIPTGGAIGKLAEQHGFTPKVWKDKIAEDYSPEQQAANKAVQDAKGFMPTIAASLQNPSTIANSVVESIPSTIAGGAIGRLAKLGGIGARVAAGVGEGAISAGQTAEQVREETPSGLLTPQQAALAAGSGALTGAIGAGSSSLASKMGIHDVDSMLVGGVHTEVRKGTLGRVVSGALTEGVLEEMPQSAQEQVAQNLATGKPWDEGVGNAAAVGALTGGAMGAGINVPGPLTRASALAQVEDGVKSMPFRTMDAATARMNAMATANPEVKYEITPHPTVGGAYAVTPVVEADDGAAAGKSGGAAGAASGVDAAVQSGDGGDAGRHGGAEGGDAARSGAVGQGQAAAAPAGMDRQLPDTGLAAAPAVDAAPVNPNAGPLEKAAALAPKQLPVSSVSNDTVSEQQQQQQAIQPDGQPTNIGAGKVDQANLRMTHAFDVAAHESASSPTNERTETPAQIEANNRKLGQTDWNGLKVQIENAQGSTRSGKDADGNPWSTLMTEHYGRIAGTEGADSKDGKKEGVDIFMGPNPDSQKVYVIDQTGKDGQFDEHKVMAGFDTLEQAKTAYYDNYQAGWKGGEVVSETGVDDLKAWLKGGDTTAPFDAGFTARQASASADGAVAPAANESAQTPAQAEQPDLSAAPSPTGSQPVAASSTSDMQQPDAPATASLAASGPDGAVDLQDGAGSSGSLRSPNKESDANSTLENSQASEIGQANSEKVRTELQKQVTQLRDSIKLEQPETPRRMRMEAQLDEIKGRIAALKSPEVARAVADKVVPATLPDAVPAFSNKLQAAQFAKTNALDATPVAHPDGGFLLQPRIAAPTAFQKKADDDSVARLNSALAREGVQVAAVHDVTPTQSVVRSIVNKAFGAKLVYVDDNKVFDGVAHGGKVFLSNALTDGQALINVAFHEVGHVLQQKDRATADALAQFVMGYVKNGVVDQRIAQEDAAARKTMPAGTTYRGMSQQQGVDEVMSDIHGAVATDPVFWSKMAAHDSGLFRKVAYRFMELLTRAIKVAKGSHYDIDRMVSDRDAVQDAIAKAWAGYNRANPTGAVDGQGQAGPLERKSDRQDRGVQAATQPVQEQSGVRGGAGVLDVAPRQDARLVPLKNLASSVLVDGKRVSFGPFGPAREAAARYREKAGLTGRRQSEYVKVDPQRATAIAAEFEAMAHDPSDPKVKASYAAMIKETLAQYQEIKATGLKIEFIDFAKTGDPYGNPRNAILDVVNNNHLWVFPTDIGFGSDATAVDVSGNPLLAKTGEMISGREALANDIFRVVHDYFGHIKEGVGFRAEGEENAWQQHSTMYSDLALPAMTTETRGQNSWLNYGPYAEFNKTANAADTKYAPQKTGLMADWTQKSGRAFARKQADTPAFKEWFGKSKVTDGDGKPLVVYHGTRGDIANFSPKDGAALSPFSLGNKGMYFTKKPGLADVYARSRDGTRNTDGGNVMPVYLRIENPLMINKGVDFDEHISSAYLSDEKIAELKSQGYDGIINDSAKEIVAFDPEQIKSAIGNNGAFDPANKDIRLSRKPPAWIATVPGMTPEIAAKVGAWVPQKTIKQRFDELRKDAGKKLVQGMMDQFAPLKQLDMKAYMLARMSKVQDGGIEAMLLYGKLHRDADGAITVDNTGGFVDMMKKLKGEQDRFFSWVAGNRAADLKANGRENLFTDTDITALKAANQGTMPDGSSRAQLYAATLRELNGFSKAILDISEQAGTIDGASRALWEKDFYVPFYRLGEDDGKSIGPTNIAGLTNQYAFKKLKGGTDNLNDLMQNTIMNWSHLLSAALKNQASQAALTAAENAGVAHRVREAQKGSVFVLDHGQKVHFMVDDPFIMDAISSVSFAGVKGRVLDVASAMKRALSFGVTFSPSYRARNLIRDQLQAIAANPMSYNVAKNLVDGFKNSAKDNTQYAQMLAGGALFRMGGAYEDNRAANLKRMIGRIDQATILGTNSKVVDMLRNAYHAYMETGDRAESITRAAIYAQNIADGKSHLEASYIARDSMDFGLQGSWPAVRILAQTVPFFNARVQGMYKLGRAMKQDPQRFAIVVGAATAATIALMLASHDDPDWKEREEFDRDNYWWFKSGKVAYRIPKPFEIGAIASIAERGLEMVMDGMDAKSRKRFADRVSQIISSNLSMNPVPQIVKPALDIYANTDPFRNRPIETPGMERMSTSERIGANTSATARLLGKAGVLSPVQIDYAIQGYFGWLGVHMAMATDAVMRPAMGLPDKATRRLDDTFVLGDWVKELPSNQSRFVTDFYAQAKRVSEAVADINHYKAVGNVDKVKELVAENRDLLKQKSGFTMATTQINHINKRLRMVSESTTMSPDQKRAESDRLTTLRNRVAERVMSRQP